MDMSCSAFAHPKPEKRVTTKRRKDRRASLVSQQVRAQCVDRDGDCRVAKDMHTPRYCLGESEWAHFEDFKRARTRGQAPERRHTTAGSLMLCTKHHQRYDAGTLQITPLHATSGCDGELVYAGAR